MNRLYFLLLVTFFNIAAANAQVIDIVTARSKSIGTTVTVSGVVTNGAEFGSNLRFFQDNTGGIAAYSSSVAMLAKGDSIVITGVLKQFNGLLELDPVTNVTVVSSNNPLPAPKVISLSTGFIEANEGMLIQVNNVNFTGSGNFGTGSSNYPITDGSVTKESRVLSTTNIGGTPIPSAKINLIGILGEYNGTYQLQPRSLNDIESAGPKFITPLSQNNITTTSFTVDFTTENPGSSIIRYGTSPAFGNIVNDMTLKTNHTLNISGLTPATLYFVQGISVNATNDTSFSGVQVMATQSLSTGDIKVYFNQPIDNSVSTTGLSANFLNQSMDDTIIAYIEKATNTLDIAIYNVDNQNQIITAINAAAARGVQVRVIANEGMTSTNYNAILVPKKKSPTGPAPSGGYYGLMHNKFVVIDAHASNPAVPYVITGSTNWTNAQVLSDANNMLIIQDQTLAKAYEREFEEMWNGKFGPEKTQNTPTQFVIGGKEVELYFSPSDNPEENLKQAIASADHEILFSMFTWTRYNISYDIKDRFDNGVFIAGVVDDTSNGGGQAFDILYGASPNTIFKYNQPGIFHHKYLIVDPNYPSSDPLVLTGSYNWTNSGAFRNDENYLIIHSDTIANLYYQEWYKRYTENGGTITVGIADNINSTPIEIVTYPNPASNMVNIMVNYSQPASAEVTIFDMTGIIISTSTLEIDGRTNFSIDTKEYKNGLYFMNFRCNDFSSTQKLMIIK